MSWWNKLFGSSGDQHRVDYYEEGLELLADGKFHEALTSFRLALKESPGDPVVLQQIAIAYTRIGMTEEAAKTYRHVLRSDPDAPGAHYGLAFLYLHGGEREQAVRHLRAFLAHAPRDPAAGEHVEHARATLAELTGEGGAPAGAEDEEEGSLGI
jgi:Flp pilus assembly protein TadD